MLNKYNKISIELGRNVLNKYNKIISQINKKY